MKVKTCSSDTVNGRVAGCLVTQGAIVSFYPKYYLLRHVCVTGPQRLSVFMMTSVPGEFPAQRPVTRSFDVFFDLRLNKRLSKQSWGWWFETPSCPLWRHCNVWCIMRLMSLDQCLWNTNLVYHFQSNSTSANDLVLSRVLKSLIVVEVANTEMLIWVIWLS